jgi:hypothetical protein
MAMKVALPRNMPDVLSTPREPINLTEKVRASG